MTETTDKKKGFSALDALIVFGVLVIVLGMVGQNVAVHMVERMQKSELFELSFVVRSYDIEDAKALIAAQQGSSGGLSLTYEEKTIGTLLTVSRVDIPKGAEGDGAVHESLCDLTGIVCVYGREEGDTPLLYGPGEVQVGDVLLVSVEKRMLALEITAVNVKKNEKPT